MERSTLDLTHLDDQSHAYDGDRFREIWKPEDGSGDGDVDLVADGHTRKGGHPTWKIFASDLPDGVQRTGNNPPIRVYLDDKACYEVVTSGVFSGNLMGKSWPYDFTGTGTVRITRPNRGRPAYLDNGEIASVRKFKGVYLFKGNTGDAAEHDDYTTPDPDAMDLSSMVNDDRTDNTELPAADSSRVVKRQKIDDRLLSKPLDELDEEDLDELRAKYIKATDEAHEAHIRAAQLHHQFSRAERELVTLSSDHKQLQEKLQQVLNRLETQHRNNNELELSLKRNNLDSLVAKRMLEKTKQELRELKHAHAVLQVRSEATDDEALSQPTGSQVILLELCKILYAGHVGSKAISKDTDDNDQSLDDLTISMSLVKETQQVIDEGLNAVQTEMQSKGLSHIYDSVVSANPGNEADERQAASDGDDE